MIREIIGAGAVTSAFGRKRRRKGMSTTMIGAVGTVIAVGVAYMAMKNRIIDEQ